MPGLVSVADGLTPQDDYSFLPPTIVAWGFYVGKPSIGSWSPGQVANLESTGRLGIPIWTPGDGGAYTRAQAQADAAAMLAGLKGLAIHDQRWVFLDIEYSRWADNPQVTTDAAAYWCGIMRLSGYPRAGWYGPIASTATWRADWTGTPPTALPAGCLGVQYDHDLAGGKYDISRFDKSILDRFGGPMSTYGPENWDDNDWQAFRSQVAETGVNTGQQLLDAARQAAAEAQTAAQELTTVLAELKTLTSQQGPLQYTTTAPIVFRAG